MGSSSLRWLNQPTPVRVAHSTVSRPCQDFRWIASAFYSPLVVSAKALSYESPTLPTEGSLLDPLPLGAPSPRRFPAVLLGLSYPVPQGLRRTADLGRDRAKSRPLRFMLALMLPHHANRSLPDFR